MIRRRVPTPWFVLKVSPRVERYFYNESTRQKRDICNIMADFLEEVVPPGDHDEGYEPEGSHHDFLGNKM